MGNDVCDLSSFLEWVVGIFFRGQLLVSYPGIFCGPVSNYTRIVWGLLFVF